MLQICIVKIKINIAIVIVCEGREKINAQQRKPDGYVASPPISSTNNALFPPPLPFPYTRKSTPNTSSTQPSPPLLPSPHKQKEWHQGTPHGPSTPLPAFLISLTQPKFISRFNPSTLHQRDPRSALFQNYTPRLSPLSPSSSNHNNSLYASSGISSSPQPGGGSVGGGAYRPATPNSRYVFTLIYVMERGRKRKTNEGGGGNSGANTPMPFYPSWKIRMIHKSKVFRGKSAC